MNTVCYLCGKQLGAEKPTGDHRIQKLLLDRVQPKVRGFDNQQRQAEQRKEEQRKEEQRRQEQQKQQEQKQQEQKQPSQDRNQSAASRGHLSPEQRQEMKENMRDKSGRGAEKSRDQQKDSDTTQRQQKQK